MHDGTTPLILAARLAVEGMLEDLINSHADVNAVDDLGKRAGAAQGLGTDGWMDGRTMDGHGPSSARPPTPGPAARTGKSALHWAAAVNNVEAALVLLKNGANKDMQSNKVGAATGGAGRGARGAGPGPGGRAHARRRPASICPVLTGPSPAPGCHQRGLSPRRESDWGLTFCAPCHRAGQGD